MAGDCGDAPVDVGVRPRPGGSLWFAQCRCGWGVATDDPYGDDVFALWERHAAKGDAGDT